MAYVEDKDVELLEQLGVLPPEVKQCEVCDRFFNHAPITSKWWPHSRFCSDECLREAHDWYNTLKGQNNKGRAAMRKIEICAKCSDMFSAQLIEDGKEPLTYNGYVPQFFPGEHYGDYVMLTIDVNTGKILDWKKPTEAQLKIFRAEEG